MLHLYHREQLLRALLSCPLSSILPPSQSAHKLRADQEERSKCDRLIKRCLKLLWACWWMLSQLCYQSLPHHRANSNLNGHASPRPHGDIAPPHEDCDARTLRGFRHPEIRSAIKFKVASLYNMHTSETYAHHPHPPLRCVLRPLPTSLCLCSLHRLAPPLS